MSLWFIFAMMICIGHRGACGHEPENTLRSIRKALELGVAGVEIDVQLVEGELLVFHDARLERTTNGRGYLWRKSFAELRSLDAGAGEQIPTLAEVLEAIDRRAFVNIELKGRRTAEPTWQVISAYIAERGWEPGHFLISSFHRRELRNFRTASQGSIPLGLLLNRPSRLFVGAARRFGATSVHPPLRFVSQRMVQSAHTAGLKVYVYTVNEPDALERMRALGVDGVFSDFPERVVAARAV